jgi:hypothetical protein
LFRRPLHRARIVAGFMAAIPISIGLGAPVSTGFLELDGVLSERRPNVYGTVD